MFQEPDPSFHQARVDEELDAACRSTGLEEKELHLQLALIYLRERRGRRVLHRAPHTRDVGQFDRSIDRTDKEA